MPWAVLLIGVCTYYLWDWFQHRQNLPDLHKRCVFITGCDTGFGRDLALRLDSMGVPVFAGCLTQSGAQDLAAETSDLVHTVLIDVMDSESILAAYEFVRDQIPAGAVLWGLVNNAGVQGPWGPLEFLTRKAFHDTYDVNVVGMADVTKTFLPLLKESGGRIVNTSSVVAVMPFPGTITYALSKIAVRGFSALLRQEKAAFGIKVSCVMPGAFRTRMTDPDVTAERMTSHWESLPDDVRHDFGEDFFKKTLSYWLEMTAQIPNADTSPVISSYIHALMASNPRHEYTPGVDCTLLAFLANLPNCLGYFILNTFILGEKFNIKSKALLQRMRK